MLNVQHRLQQLCHVLKIWQNIDCGQLADGSMVLPAQAGDAHIMCHWVLHLLQTYSSCNKGRRSVQTAASLRQDAVGESYRYTLSSCCCSHQLSAIVGRCCLCACGVEPLPVACEVEFLPVRMWESSLHVRIWGLKLCLCASLNGFDVASPAWQMQMSCL